ncbi:conserved hypothetical protein [Lebetimonas natsushimae]|uniref:FecR protein domain-containing protein n=1 Tax=Lebetimonas natsushimae TaxID=1936991 RepID=A0A292YBT0_9BACT|nr:FecR family protein [Lebetimonas natsushimae]GAX86961.1 conserved hypothetical protein [Lebetimonas natsushimae]
MRFLLILVAIFLYANIGNIKEIKGGVKVVRNHKTLKAYVNMPIEKKDTIYTYNNSKAKIIFKDKTIITLGKNSVFKVEDYVYGKKPRAKFSFLKGAFVSVDGKIAKIAPKRFKLKTKNASIGIRGTTVFGEISDKKDIIGCTQGLISVSKNGQEVLVKPGEMVKVFTNKITSPVKIPQSYLNKLVKKLSLNKKEIKSFFKQININRQNKVTWGDYIIETPVKNKNINNDIDTHVNTSHFVVEKQKIEINNKINNSETTDTTNIPINNSAGNLESPTIINTYNSNNGNHNGQDGTNNGNHNGQSGSMMDNLINNGSSMMNNMMNNGH